MTNALVEKMLSSVRYFYHPLAQISTEADRSHEKHTIDRANTTWNIDLHKKH